jgi:DNA-binding IscR family transcriptional regulator
MRRLAVAEVVQARRGVRGGFRLARPPSEIRFLDVLLAVEPAEEGPARCAFGHPRCDATHPCPMHGAYLALQGCFHRWAEHATLADLGEDVGRYLGAVPTGS